MELISKFRIIFVVQSIIGNITATIGSRARFIIETTENRKNQDRVWRHPRIGTLEVQHSILHDKKRNIRRTRHGLSQILVAPRMS